MNYLNKLYQVAKEKRCTIKGCTDEEIKTVQQYASQKLPECYIEFLQIMGKEAYFLTGYNYNFAEVMHLRGSAESMMFEAYGDNGLTFLRKDDFVFFDSQGCTCCFFNLTEGDNPPVYFYSGLLTQPVKITETLSAFLIAMESNDISIFKVDKKHDYRY